MVRYLLATTIFGIIFAEKRGLKILFISFIFFLCSGLFIAHEAGNQRFFPLVAFAIIFVSSIFPLLKNKQIPYILFVCFFTLSCLFLSNFVSPLSAHKTHPFIRFSENGTDIKKEQLDA